MARRKSIEDCIHKACAGLLRGQEWTYKDFLFYHCPNGLVSTASMVSRLKTMGMRAGVADLTICFKHITGHVELKAEDTPTQESQKEFKLDCERVGIPYYIIRTDNPYTATKELERIMEELRGMA